MACTCERCGTVARSRVLHEFDTGQPAQFWCRPCHEGSKGWATGQTQNMRHDEIPGGMWLENYGPEPVKVYSHSERRALLNTIQYDKTTGQPYVLTEKDNFAPMPGTDRDAQGIPNPNGYRDLSAAAILARNGRPSLDADETLDSLSGGPRLDRHDPDDVPNDPSFVDPAVRPFKYDSDAEGARAFLRVVRETLHE